MDTIVVFGNCHAEMIAMLLKSLPEITSKFDIIRHGIELAKMDLAQSDTASLVEQAKGACIYMTQSISDWKVYPFREYISPKSQIINFPFVYLTPLWPFEYQFGLDDVAMAHRSENKDLFLFHDAGLALLRESIKDHECRYHAYRNLDSIKPNLKRTFELESHRLKQADRDLETTVGQKMLDSFRDRRLFHTITHPANQVFVWLIEDLLKKIGLGSVKIDEGAVELMGGYQVPLHPWVIQELGIEWADENTIYRCLDQYHTFESYVRKYIDYYG